MYRITLATVYIAGMKHYVPNPEAFSMRLLAGNPVELRPEPTNEYDEFAVEVFWKAKDGTPRKIGYVPARLSKEISTYISAGRNIKAEVAEDGKPKIIIFEEVESSPSNNTI